MTYKLWEQLLQCFRRCHIRRRWSEPFPWYQFDQFKPYTCEWNTIFIPSYQSP